MFAAEFGTGQMLWSMLWLTLFVIWIALLVSVFTDIFRSHDIGGFAKAMWVLFVIVVPYFGVFVYLIARGHKMSEHETQRKQAQEAAITQAVQESAGTGSGTSAADELAKLAKLRDDGMIEEAEFQRLKSDVYA